MPTGKNHKMKMVAIVQILKNETDAEHGITLPEIQRRLWEEYEITAGRKSIYNDISYINDYLSVEITGQKHGATFDYRMTKRLFTLAELKLLVDSVVSSKFISAAKSKELIAKISALASKYEASQLNRQIILNGRVKTMNESIYLVVDDVHHAILDNRQIKFDYMVWTPEKKLERKKSYVVSPWALVRDNENYYLVAYDENQGMIKHFRMDKIKNVQRTKNARTGREKYRIASTDIPVLHFGMFGGKKRTVRLKFTKDKLTPIIDRLGKDIEITASSPDGWYQTTAEIVLSGQFYGWVLGLGKGVIIDGPKDVQRDFWDHLSETLSFYPESYRERYGDKIDCHCYSGSESKSERV